MQFNKLNEDFCSDISAAIILTKEYSWTFDRLLFELF